MRVLSTPSARAMVDNFLILLSRNWNTKMLIYSVQAYHKHSDRNWDFLHKSTGSKLWVKTQKGRKALTCQGFYLLTLKKLLYLHHIFQNTFNHTPRKNKMFRTSTTKYTALPQGHIIPARASGTHGQWASGLSLNIGTPRKHAFINLCSASWEGQNQTWLLCHCWHQCCFWHCLNIIHVPSPMGQTDISLCWNRWNLPGKVWF